MTRETRSRYPLSAQKVKPTLSIGIELVCNVILEHILATVLQVYIGSKSVQNTIYISIK